MTALIAPFSFSAVALGLLVYDHFGELGELGDVPTGLAVATLVASQAPETKQPAVAADTMPELV